MARTAWEEKKTACHGQNLGSPDCNVRGLCWACHGWNFWTPVNDATCFSVLVKTDFFAWHVRVGALHLKVEPFHWGHCLQSQKIWCSFWSRSTAPMQTENDLLGTTVVMLLFVSFLTCWFQGLLVAMWALKPGLNLTLNLFPVVWDLTYFGLVAVWKYQVLLKLGCSSIAAYRVGVFLAMWGTMWSTIVRSVRLCSWFLAMLLSALLTKVRVNSALCAVCLLRTCTVCHTCCWQRQVCKVFFRPRGMCATLFWLVVQTTTFEMLFFYPSRS